MPGRARLPSPPPEDACRPGGRGDEEEVASSPSLHLPCRRRSTLPSSAADELRDEATARATGGGVGLSNGMERRSELEPRLAGLPGGRVPEQWRPRRRPDVAGSGATAARPAGDGRGGGP